MSAANKGKKVTWAVHTRHGGKTRTGFIVDYVPPKTSMVAAAMKASGKTHSPVDAVDESPSARYLMRVDRETSRGVKSEWFAPYASTIDAALVAAEAKPEAIAAE